MLIGGAIGDEAHEAGDVVEVQSAAQAKRWIKAGIAEEWDQRPVNEEGESLNKDGSVSKHQPEDEGDDD